MNPNNYTRSCSRTSIYTTIFYYVIICFHRTFQFHFWFCICCYFVCHLIHCPLPLPCGLFPLHSRLHIWLYFAFTIFAQLSSCNSSSSCLSFCCLYIDVQSSNSLDRVTSIPLGSPVVGLLHFSPYTCVFCSISAADDKQLYRCASVPRYSLVWAGCTRGRWRWVLGRRGYWLHFITPNKRLKPLTLFQTGKGILTYVKFERMRLKPLLPSTKRYITMSHNNV
jgi:hypothetical protein